MRGGNEEEGNKIFYIKGGPGKLKGHVALKGSFQKGHDWLRRGSKFLKNWLRGIWMAPNVSIKNIWIRLDVTNCTYLKIITIKSTI